MKIATEARKTKSTGLVTVQTGVFNLKGVTGRDGIL